MNTLIDNFYAYISSMGYWKLVHVIWFYLLFEFLRYILIEGIGISLWKIKKKLNRRRWHLARKQLYREHPKISIIVPGKNEGKHIYKLAVSLREQTYKNVELIIIDDGSDDLTPRICRSLQKNKFIDLFLRNEVRGGKASAANLGLRCATGKYIIHLDADCSYDNDAIEKILIPFYYDQKIAAVGGNVLVRNYKENVITTLQAIEYLDAISIGRTVSSELGIYRVISGAFGAFRKDMLDRLGGWDIGPGLDGDITVKIRKLGYKVKFEPAAVCLTSVPNTPKKLIKQRLRWDKSLVRFRLRKHRDVFLPTQNFRLSNFIAFSENITFNIVLNIAWFVYITDMIFNFPSELQYIAIANILLYTANNFFKFLLFSPFRERQQAPLHFFLPYIPLMVFYFGYLMRVVRSVAYTQELLFKASYNDSWNPQKSSKHARAMRI